MAQDNGLALRTGTKPAHTRKSVVLPAPFGPRSKHDLATFDGEVSTGECGEAAEQADGRTEEHDGVHDGRGTVPRAALLSHKPVSTL